MNYRWRVSHAQRYKNGKMRDPDLLKASRILSKITGITMIRMTQLVNENKSFIAPFRGMVQCYDQLSDCGYKASIVEKTYDKDNSSVAVNNNNSHIGGATSRHIIEPVVTTKHRQSRPTLGRYTRTSY